MAERLSIMIYAQALSGVGHYVRSFEIARALSQKHQVQLIDGGRRVPRPAEHEVQRLEVPRIVRRGGKLVPLDSSESFEVLMRRRGNVLREAVARLQPQVLIIEHYPFSKWELEGEITALIAAARAACQELLIVGSLRDILLQTSFEECSAEHYVSEVLRRVERDFDALMVHGEERLTPLGRSFAGTAALRVPLCYTGIVAEARAPAPVVSRPYVLVSSGGGSDPLRIAEAVSAALATPRLAEVARVYQLIVCQTLIPEITPSEAEVRSFDPDFLGLLAGASLSVSYAGYNTCANLLTTRRRALLAIHPGMSDQAPRAALMESLGAATRVPATGWAPAPLAEIMATALAEPMPAANAQLDGAGRSAAFIQWLWEERRGAAARLRAKKTPL